MTGQRLPGGVVVCGPDPAGWRKRYWRCPMCECRTETVAQLELWYGLSVACCRCGDSWGGEGELRPRPLARYWRRDAIRRARRLWDQASHGPFPTLHELDPHLFPDPDDPSGVLEDATGRGLVTVATTGGVL